jgi:hypothetical protein
MSNIGKPTCILVLTSVALLPSSHAQALDDRIKQGVELIKLACGTGTSSNRFDISGDARGSITLRRLPGATAGGSITYSKEEAQGLISALKKEVNSESLQLSAKQIDCMKPYADRIFDALFPRPPQQKHVPVHAPVKKAVPQASNVGMHRFEVPADVANLWVFYQRRGKEYQSKPDRGCSSPKGLNPKIEPLEAVKRIDEFVAFAKANDAQLIFVAQSRTRGYVGAADEMRFDGKPLLSNTPFWCEGQERFGYEVPLS